MNRSSTPVEKYFEKFLWSSRYLIIVAVLASLAGAVAMLYVATVDAVELISHLPDYHRAADPDQRMALRSGVVTHIVEMVDGYLLASIMLIFSLGLYELFISGIDPAVGSENKSRVLVIENLDDLKDRLAKVVLLILIVKFFEQVLSLTFETPLELLYLAVGIALVAGALFLSHGKSHGSHEKAARG
ncbi:MAG TPA: YqhA family protein [Thermoanaerobaculia bacterium]|nr:YqhA family protein [Thermoanaerobaculia bacterium]